MTVEARARRLATALTITVLAGAMPACAATEGNEAEAAQETARASGSARTLGTIEATVDGRSLTWYVLAGTVADGPWASGIWFESSEGTVHFSLGGLDSENAPIETMSRGGDNPYGDYRGSTMALNVELTPGSAPLQRTVPDHERTTMVVYTPVATITDMTGMYAMVTGTVEVERAEVEDGEARVEGRFSGTFSPMEGEGSIEITEGRFSAEGLPNVDAILPAGGGP